MKGIDVAAELMAIAATTAPKSKGENYVQVKILKGQAIKRLAAGMAAFGKRVKKENFDRDGKNVEKSEAVVLIGLKKATTVGLNCGACGFQSCSELLRQKAAKGEFKGFVCAFRILDMGIALGSAVRTASMLNVDNRIMYRIGAAARDMKLVDWDYVMGIPLSATGKSIYFDR